MAGCNYNSSGVSDTPAFDRGLPQRPNVPTKTSERNLVGFFEHGLFLQTRALRCEKFTSH